MAPRKPQILVFFPYLHVICLYLESFFYILSASLPIFDHVLLLQRDDARIQLGDEGGVTWDLESDSLQPGS